MQNTPEQLYLELLKKTLTFSLWPEPPVEVKGAGNSLKQILLKLMGAVLSGRDLFIARKQIVTDRDRLEGLIWPGYADTMIGMKRLNNIQQCVENVLKNNVEGDFIETGVWRGGTCIFMRGTLEAYGDASRKVYVADSFEGLPKANPVKYPADEGDRHHTYTVLAVSKEEVENNFRRYGLLDDRVVFLKGWFKDTLPTAPIEQLAILRLDGDMYESTMDALTSLYPKLSKGGYCIVDDYALKGCQRAVDDFRRENDISSELRQVDWTGWYWVKE